MLKIQKLILEKGLQSTIDELRINCIDYGHKIILQYDQLNSVFSNPATLEARGLILEKNTWRVMSLPFVKFFNYNESKAANIDWKTARAYTKYDGTCIHVYYDWVLNEWCIGTLGTADASGTVLYENTEISLAQLFLTICKIKNPNKSYTYAFELCSPYNTIITPYKIPKCIHLTTRDLSTLKEIDINIDEYFEGHEVPEYITGTSLEFLLETFYNAPYYIEGYVIVDSNFNRIKVKNPAYVAAHLLKGNTTDLFRLVDIVKTGEIDEYCSYFPEKSNIIQKLNEAYNSLKTALSNIKNILLNSNEYNEYVNIQNRDTQKNIAIYIQNLCKTYNCNEYNSYFFSILKNEKLTVDKYMTNVDNKKLYSYLIK